MYTVIGIKPEGSQCKPLEYPTLEQAMKKLQDLIEADEMELEGGQDAMFVRYTVIPKHGRRDATTPSGEWSGLRLAR